MNGRNRNGVYSWRASFAHVSGREASRQDTRATWCKTAAREPAPNNLNYRVNNGIPNQLTMFINDYPKTTWMRADGFFVQQRWTRERLSLQGALRLDIAQAGRPHSRWARPGSCRHRSCFRTPRSWTATRTSVRARRPPTSVRHREDGAQGVLGHVPGIDRTGGPYTVGNPTSRIAQTVARSWTDANGNLNPDCELLNPVAQDLRASGGDFCGVLRPELRDGHVQQQRGSRSARGLGRATRRPSADRLRSARSVPAGVR